MITIKNIKVSELYDILNLLREEHGNFVSSYNEMLHQEHCDYDDGLVVVIDIDTIEIDIYHDNITVLVEKKKPQEVLKLLIKNVDRDMKEFFRNSVVDFERFEEINNVEYWVDFYRESLSDLTEIIKKFLYDNGYTVDDLMINAKEIFRELIKGAREMFPDEEEE
jgi:hypothetical protein